MNLSSSTLHYKPKVPRELREKSDADLRSEIEKVRMVHKRSGYRTMLHYLQRNGVIIGETKLRRVMGKYDLHGQIKKAFVRTTDSEHGHRVYPNLLKYVKATKVNEIWASDFTYIRIENGFVYLAVILDLFSRKVVGWAVSRNIDSDLAVSALNMAIQKRKPANYCIHHSDRGVQYLGKKYIQVLKENHFQISYSA